LRRRGEEPNLLTRPQQMGPRRHHHVASLDTAREQDAIGVKSQHGDRPELDRSIARVEDPHGGLAVFLEECRAGEPTTFRAGSSTRPVTVAPSRISGGALGNETRTA
jgi:hypothetical protein